MIVTVLSPTVANGPTVNVAVPSESVWVSTTPPTEAVTVPPGLTPSTDTSMVEVPSLTTTDAGFGVPMSREAVAWSTFTLTVPVAAPFTPSPAYSSVRCDADRQRRPATSMVPAPPLSVVEPIVVDAVLQRDRAGGVGGVTVTGPSRRPRTRSSGRCR